MVIALLILLLGLLSPVGGGEMFDPLGLGLRGVSGVAIYFTCVFAFFGLMALAFHAVKKNWFNLHSVVPVFYLIPKWENPYLLATSLDSELIQKY